MHLNVSGPCGHFGNRPEAAPLQALNWTCKAARKRRNRAARLPPSPFHNGSPPAKTRAAVVNYMPVTCENPRDCWEAAPLRPPSRETIWRIPEPPILFLLVGKRGNAGNGSESALQNADVAQLVEHHLAKVDVASS